MRLVVALVILLCPMYADAALIINEVAWMGSTDNPNDEWIELYNNGTQEVDVTDWVLSDGQNLDIVLTGSIPSGGYAVLERTDDSSAPGTAFFIYTGALSNEGRTLSLLRRDGSLEDQVAGGERWENIGGDNTTKETAQYTQSGWTTGAPTPGQANVSYTPPREDEEEEEKDEQKIYESSSASVSRSRGEDEKPIELVLPDVTLDLTLTAPTLAYVHEPLQFRVTPRGIGDTLMESLKMNWNFGDLSTARGREVNHTYEHPGTYVVVVHGEYARQHAKTRHEITVLPVNFSLSTTKDGDLQLHNEAKYEVDLSGYSLRGDETLVFPERTILLPNATLTIAKERLGDTSVAWLMDQEHMVVASTMPEPRSFAAPTTKDREGASVAAAQEALPPVPPVTTPAASPAQSEPEDDFRFSDDTEGNSVGENSFIESAEAEEVGHEEGIENSGAGKRRETQTAAVADAAVPLSSEKLPYLGLIGLLSLGVLSLYVTRGQK